jgi:hypothetical protein
LSESELVRLVYVSQAKAGLKLQDCESILNSAVRVNSERGITGVLFLHRGRFLQALEGEREAVADVYAHIERDRRHHGCVLLGVDRIAARAFASWSMGWLPVVGESGALVDQFLMQLREFDASVAHPAATALLTLLASKAKEPRALLKPSPVL